jgi:hypothetical protein
MAKKKKKLILRLLTQSQNLLLQSIIKIKQIFSLLKQSVSITSTALIS